MQYYGEYPYMSDQYNMINPMMGDYTWMPRYPLPDRRMPDPYSYPGNLPMAIQLIAEAIASEREDELFYDYLLKNAPSEEDKSIITSIRDDERKHFGLFRQIYSELTCRMPPTPQEPEITLPASYCEGVKKALFGELSAIEKYRRILYALQDRVQINKLIEIITDEIKHASKWNYLYTKNECFEEEGTED